MSYRCSYSCSETFASKYNMDRHIKKFHAEEDLPTKRSQEKIRLKLNLKSREVNESTVTGVIQGAMTESLAPIMRALETLSIENRELKKRLDEQRPNVTVNNVSNTVIFNCFDYKMIDIFKILLDKYGSDKAISFSSRLLKGKTKETKHDWVTNPELGLNMESLSKVLSLSYESGERDPCFNILNAEQKVITDRDGSMVDKILTDTVVDAGLKAQSYVAKEATEAGDLGDKVGMWDNWSNSSIYNSQNHETIHDDIFRYQKILPSKKHLINVVKNVKNHV